MMNNLRLFVAVPRSGSTLLMRVMAGHPDVASTSRHILMGKMEGRANYSQKGRKFAPDYSIFEDPSHPIYDVARENNKSWVVSKEEFGNDRHTGTEGLNECNYKMFPGNDAILSTRPAFIFRRPDHTYDSWLVRGWNDLDSFILTYRNHIDTFEKALSLRPETVFFTYEYMVRDRECQIKVFQAVCKDWGLEFNPHMLEFDKEFGSEFLYSKKSEQKIYKENNPKGIFTTIAKHSTIRADIKPHGILSEADAEKISTVLMPYYLRIHGMMAQRFALTPPSTGTLTLNPNH